MADGAGHAPRNHPGPIALAAFIFLATLNSAGYRYGAADQAFYVPAILERLDDSLFPRDASLIVSQAQLTIIDESVAVAARVSRAPLPVLFAILYVLSLVLLAWGAHLIAAAIYRTRLAGLALLAALTLRHAIARTGTNTLEGYFHPRQLAFALGTLALAAFLRSRQSAVIWLLIAAAVVHPTTALWFIVWLGIAAVAAEPRLRRAALPVGGGLALVAIWGVTGGPLAGRLVAMDREWLDTLTEKDYLFPLQWPAWVWLLNLAYVPIILLIYRMRRDARLVGPRERALLAGALSLLAIFVIALVLHVQPIALAVQLQPSRIFWMLDFMAVLYAVWALAEGTALPSWRRTAVAASLILAASVARGTYVAVVRFPERAVAQLTIRDDDWGRAMAWARDSAPESGWLADPLHAARYGTSLRVAGHRDVLVEAIKDTAIGIYDRDVAMRTRDRLAAIGPFEHLTADRARALATQYELDYLVIDRDLPLPVVFRSGELRIYGIR